MRNPSLEPIGLLNPSAVNTPLQTNFSGFINPHSFGNKVARALWKCAWLGLFRFSPWICFGWRNLILCAFGAKIGDARIHPSVVVWAPWLLRIGDGCHIGEEVNFYNPYEIVVGDRVVISRGAVLCTPSHDYRDPRYALSGSKITVEDDCWICTEAFLLPGVTIGAGAVVGARAVTPRDVPPWTVVAGNPATIVCSRELRE